MKGKEGERKDFMILLKLNPILFNQIFCDSFKLNFKINFFVILLNFFFEDFVILS